MSTPAHVPEQVIASVPTCSVQSVPKKKFKSRDNFLDRFQPWGAVILRLALGISVAVPGYEKVVPQGALHHFAVFVGTLGIPSWLGFISAFTEFLGGMCVLLGLLTRIASGFIAINMLVALFAVGIHQDFSKGSSIFALVAIAVMLVLNGSGTLSIDKAIEVSLFRS
jgi:putative oxidoreductase